jgi:hypothetical protein
MSLGSLLLSLSPEMRFSYPLEERYVNRFGRVFGENFFFENSTEEGISGSKK